MSNNDYTYIIEFLDDDGTLYIYDIDDKIQSKLLGNFFMYIFYLYGYTIVIYIFS